MPPDGRETDCRSYRATSEFAAARRHCRRQAVCVGDRETRFAPLPHRQGDHIETLQPTLPARRVKPCEAWHRCSHLPICDALRTGPRGGVAAEGVLRRFQTCAVRKESGEERYYRPISQSFCSASPGGAERRADRLIQSCPASAEADMCSKEHKLLARAKKKVTHEARGLPQHGTLSAERECGCDGWRCRRDGRRQARTLRWGHKT